jgi:uncharacterized protein YajQ (UPF0234 family)
MGAAERYVHGLRRPSCLVGWRRHGHARRIGDRVAQCRVLRTAPARAAHPLTTSRLAMAQLSSFDVTTGVDLQEVDNAVNQAQKEIAQRYDFKGSKAEIEFLRAEDKLALVADSDFQMQALFDVLQAKLIKRGVSVKNLDIGEIKQAGGDTVRREITLKTALDGDTAKKVAAAIKEAKLKKVQAAIQGEQVRVSAPSKDELQEAMGVLRAKEFGVELKFGNYR